MTELILARHGETEWNRTRRFQGHADPPLNETGRAQARILADTVAGWQPDAVYASDLRRARQTAEYVAALCGVPLTALTALREIDVGEWQGLTWPEIEERYPSGAKRWRERGHGWERGESYEQLLQRVLRALWKISGRHPSGRVVVVGHGGVVRAVAAHIEGASIAQHRRQSAPLGNCELVRIAVRDDVIRRTD